jgi:hypothetical protein
MYDLNIQDQRHHLTTAGMYSNLGTDILFKCRVGRGLISIVYIMKSEDASGPFISEISKAAYEDHFPLHTLRYIFVTNVSNTETKIFAKARLDLTREEKFWKNNTPEFKAMLGTQIRKVVACFIQVSFQRGTQKISRVALWKTGQYANFIQARFDIEKIYV